MQELPHLPSPDYPLDFFKPMIDKLYHLFLELGFKDEDDLSRQASPRKGRVTAWTGEDCSAVIIGLEEDKWVNFMFDANMKFNRIIVSD
jgi:hypothetical protein